MYYADALLTGDAAFMLRAMQECDWSAEVLAFADDALRSDKSFLMMAARQDVEAMNFAHPSVGLAGDTAPGSSEIPSGPGDMTGSLLLSLESIWPTTTGC